MRTLLIDTDRLGPVRLREAPRRLERDGTAVVTSDGEALFMGRLVVPGGARSSYAERPAPREVRLKTLGSDRGLRPGIVRLEGRVTLTAWYQKGRGRDAGTSELTVSAERITPASGAPTVTGWLPVKFMTPNPGDAPFVDGELALDGGGFTVYLSLPEGSVEGTAEVFSASSVAAYVGQQVTVDLGCKLVVPDREDVGRTAKAELVLVGSNWQPADQPSLVSAGRRRSEPTPEVEAVAAS